MLAALEQAAAARHLTVLGGFHPEPSDGAPPGCGTLLLLGPDEPAFWPAFRDTPEARDGAAHPMDRWSRRVIGDWAAQIGATPVFPFGGPPYAPFFRWATRSGRIHASPIMLLVHDRAGLFVSFRGALALPRRIDLPAPPPNPCDSCIDRPCRTACPVDAFDGTAYDVAGCKAHITGPDTAACRSRGCAARRACPVSARLGRHDAQSAFHMASFTGG
ncbi:MAG: ferredoxin [Rhodobacteraceae bacterium]|nr:ferredoxin [Paracoccaceae bacterium]